MVMQTAGITVDEQVLKEEMDHQAGVFQRTLRTYLIFGSLADATSLEGDHRVQRVAVLATVAATCPDGRLGLHIGRDNDVDWAEEGTKGGARRQGRV